LSAFLLSAYDLLISRGSTGERPDLLEKKSLSAGGKDAVRRADLLIEDQKRRTAQPFGKSTVAVAGCEVIALYNALCWRFGEERISFEQLIAIFEKRGMALGGRWGTSPKALHRWLKKSGFRTVLESRASRFDEAAAGCDSVIVSFFNDRKNVLRGVHTVCMTREAAGFVIHNLTEDGRTYGPYDQVSTGLMQATAGKAGPLCLIGMKKEKS
jgi:hypothetical protein